MEHLILPKVNNKETEQLSNSDTSIDFLTTQLPALANTVSWVWSSFDELDVRQLYSILQLRESIFIVEQNVPYPDIDGKDVHCKHLMGILDQEVVGYMRIVPLNIYENGYYSLGRVTVKSDLRSYGIGRQLVQLGINYLDEVRNGNPVKISSQLYLKDFYSSFGFIAQGESYIEDRIPHIAMVRA